MKKLVWASGLLVLLAAFFLSGCGHHGAQAVLPKDTARGSLPYEVQDAVGGATIRINYYAPAVRGRIIWGGLVPYDAVWVTGAHNATTLDVNRDFRVGNTTIPSGKYALFTIPGRNDWAVIINKRWKQHLADDYSEAEDVVRIAVRPEITEGLTERLRYTIEKKGGNTATINISWEKLRVPFDLTVL